MASKREGATVRGISMPQIKALTLAIKEGNVFAGYNHSGGARHRVSFWTLVSCVDRGWLRMLSPAGSLSYFVATNAGRALPCLYDQHGAMTGLVMGGAR